MLKPNKIHIGIIENAIAILSQDEVSEEEMKEAIVSVSRIIKSLDGTNMTYFN